MRLRSGAGGRFSRRLIPWKLRSSSPRPLGKMRFQKSKKAWKGRTLTIWGLHTGAVEGDDWGQGVGLERSRRLGILRSQAWLLRAVRVGENLKARWTLDQRGDEEAAEEAAGSM